MFELSSKKECCGCAGCSQICPVDAIEMKMDKEGFLYPFNKKIIVLIVDCVKKYVRFRLII